MNTAHDALAAIAHTGERHYSSAPLAQSHGRVARRVRAHRAVQNVGATAAGVGLVAGGTYAWTAWGGAAAAPLGASQSSAASATTDPSPSSASPTPLASAALVDTLAIPSGKTVDWVANALAEAYGATEAEAMAAIDDAVARLAPEATGSEGWIGDITMDLASSFPTLQSAADELVAARVAQLDELGVVPEDRERVLTLASLVSREVPLDVDRPKVARVILNRLHQDMFLQLDSTVKYLMPGDGSAFTSDDDRAIDSPYNTYSHRGLPPGPIASPGLADLQAAVAPAEGDWLYFVVVNRETGEMAYAITFEEHQDNVWRLRGWLEANSSS